MNSNSKFIADLVKNTNGRFFGITFLKKDGSVRELNGRLGVKKYLKNDHSNDQPSEKPSNVIVAFDRKIKQYRSINPDRILSVRINGVKVVLRNPLKID